MSALLFDVVVAIQFTAAAMGAVVYVSSFFGYSHDDTIMLLAPAYLLAGITVIPAWIRDRKFFLQYWNIGIRGLRRRFPMQMYPARRESWLNPLAWILFLMLLLHFVAIVLSSPTAMPGAELRLRSFMVIVIGLTSALVTRYPPTLTPQS